MFARQLVIDLHDDCDTVAARIRSRLRGPLGWGAELMVPVVRVGSGPPGFLGHLDGRRVTLHAVWRPNLALGQRSLLGVHAELLPGDRGCRLSARIAPRPLMFAWLSPAALMLLMSGVVRSLPFAIAAAGGIVYWAVVVARDLNLTERALRAMLAPVEEPSRRAEP